MKCSLRICFAAQIGQVSDLIQDFLINFYRKKYFNWKKRVYREKRREEKKEEEEEDCKKSCIIWQVLHDVERDRVLGVWRGEVKRRVLQ